MAFRRRLIMRIAAASHSSSSVCDWPPVCAMSCLTPREGGDWHKAGRRLASALSWRCFSAGHHQLQHPPPTADPAVPSSPSNAAVVHAPPLGVFVCEKNIGRAEREILVPVSHRNHSFRTLCTWLSRQLLILRIELSALLAPCQAWHGYGVSTAHHGEVRGCRRACERTPLRGRRRCAAGGRLPNALRSTFLTCSGKTVHGRISRRMRATGEEEAYPIEIELLKLFTICTVCAGLQQLQYAPVVVSRPSQQCHVGNPQVRARPLTT
jgi:hypothetical protein